MAVQRIKLKFGKPEHGWLPVEFKSDNFEIFFDASDVPVDPIYQLYDALFLILKGIDAEVWWHLEPGRYCFYFSCHHKFVNLKIYSDTGETSKGKFEYEISGEFEAIILPIYRSIKEFVSFNYQEPHWPPIDNEKIAKLTELIKEMKQLRDN